MYVTINLTEFNQWFRINHPGSEFCLRQDEMPARVVGRHHNDDWGDCYRLQTLHSVFSCPVRLCEEYPFLPTTLRKAG